MTVRRIKRTDSNHGPSSQVKPLKKLDYLMVVRTLPQATEGLGTRGSICWKHLTISWNPWKQFYAMLRAYQDIATIQSIWLQSKLCRCYHALSMAW